MANEYRRGRRVACDDKCLLLFNGVEYPCKLENISISGVLVECDGPVPEQLSPGDRCGLLLCRDPRLCPGMYPAKVARLDLTRVGLRFLNLDAETTS